MFRTRLLAHFAFALAGALAWITPQVADACSCFPELHLDWPKDGGEMAANDLIRLTDFCAGVAVDEIDVLVDGEQAQLSAAQRGPLSGFEILPAPEPGATVEIVACPGYGSCEELEDAEWDTSEAMVEYSFTVGEPDEEAPPAPLLASAAFELIDVDVYDGGECGGEVNGTRPAQDWTVELDRDQDAAQQMLAYVVTVSPDDGQEPTVKHHYVRRGGGELEIGVQRFFDTNEPGQNICATVQAFDMAGNESDAVTECQFLEGNDSDPDHILEDGEHIPVDQQSCACTADRGSEGAAGMMLALLGLLGLRRRWQT